MTGANESTPLLHRNTEQVEPHETHETQQTDHFEVSQNDSRLDKRHSLSALLSRRQRDDAISSAIDDEFDDGGELTRQRSRLSSYPLLPEPEYIKKKHDAAVTTIERVDDSGSEGHGRDNPDSKYMWYVDQLGFVEEMF